MLKPLFSTAAMIAIIAGATSPLAAGPISAPTTVEITVDLSAAQAELTAQLNSVRKTDRCDENYNIWDATIRPNGQSITVDFQARWYKNWCTILTVPEFRGFSVRMKDRVVAEGLLISQSGHIAVNVWPGVDSNNVTVNTEVVTADMGGLLGKLKLTGQVKAFLNGKIREALRAKLTTALPAELVKAGVKFHDITFVDLGGGKLGLRAKVTGTLTAS